MISPEEEIILNVACGKISPGFRLFRRSEFMQALQLAIGQHRGDPECSKLNGGVHIPRLVLKVCKNPRREGYGVPFPWWWLFFEMQLLPGIQSDPWSEVKWWLWDECRGKGWTLTMHGSQNSSKSSWSGRFAQCQMVAWGPLAEIYVTGPFKKHSDDKVWKVIEDWTNFLSQGKSPFANELGLRFGSLTEECYVKYPDGTQGTSKFVSLEKASAIQGKKSQIHDLAGMEGITLLIVDEFIENPNIELIQAEGNAASNYNFFCILSCNPLPDKTRHPSLLKFSEPLEFSVSSLRRDEHYRWRTPYGILARFAWSNCPNKLIDRSEWTYLLTVERIRRAKDKGSNVIDSQIDAWCWGSLAGSAPLDEASIRMAGTYNDFSWEGPRTGYMAVDAAFGGDDPAGATILEAGHILTRDAAENPVRRRILAGVDQIIFPVDADFHATASWIREMRELMAWTGGGFPKTEGIAPIKDGDWMGGAWHLVYQVLKAAINFPIPSTNITFDSSQRGDCTAVFLTALGPGNVRWFYEGSRKITDEEGSNWFYWPPEYVHDGESVKPMKWSGVCSQCISMMWFFACHFIRHGHLTNGKSVKRGLDELCARPVVRGRHGQGEGRKDVLGKEKLKDMGMQSPIWGETLAMAIYYAVRFHDAVTLDAPQLATQSITMLQGPGEFISGGRNKRFQMSRGFFSNSA